MSAARSWVSLPSTNPVSMMGTKPAAARRRLSVGVGVGKDLGILKFYPVGAGFHIFSVTYHYLAAGKVWPESVIYGLVLGDFPVFALSTQGKSMNPTCPNCNSSRIITRNRARKAAGLIGTVGGCVGGATGSLSGIEIGMTVGIVAGPPGMVFGGVLGALFGAVVGGTAGGLSGARLGELVDRRILDNYRCLACGHCFSLSAPEPTTF